MEYHAQTTQAAMESLATSIEGLSNEEARRRLETYGDNQLPTNQGRNPLVRFVAQFNNALIYFLLAAAIVALLLHQYVDGIVIIAVVVINAIIGFVQEGKAETALNAIRGMISPRATVIRAGRRTTMPASEVVPGDIVVLNAGDRVPADLRLVRVRGVLIEEAVLTGESVAAEKQEEAVAPDAALGDRSCMAYSGTMVAAGQGVGVTVATGAETEIGRISAMLGDVQELTTPLLRQINKFGRRFTWVTIGSAGALFLFAVTLRDFPWADALLAVVALAVSAIPEGLPAVITITLAIGVQRMAARNAITRRLPAVETLGATSVICSDKTGTLTRNEMTARQVIPPGQVVQVQGSGYAPQTEHKLALMAAAAALVRTGLLCNDATIREHEGQWLAEGDPMEGALVTLAAKAGLDPEETRRQWHRHDEIPFDAQHRFMATLNQAPDGQREMLVKGAPEKLLEMCSTQQGAEGSGELPLDTHYWTEQIAHAAAEGERVLGFAVKMVGPKTSEISFADLQQDLKFLGLVGFIDPPREEAITAVAECHSAGIAVKMITGDHAATAQAIAGQLALSNNPRVLTGHELETMSDVELKKAAHGTTVFARTSPEHKLRIVRALQADGAVVAMTGDGVNDAPSLKQADIGIAMGEKGTEAAKEAAQMVLLDDNFATIVAAVHEGRTVYDNIRKVAAWTLPTNGGEVLTVLAAILFNFTLPMSPAQILWINMITAITLGLVLAFEPPEADVMQRPPRAPNAALLSPFLVWRIALVSLVFAGGTLSMFYYALHQELQIETARTMAVNTLVVLEIFYLFNVRYLHKSSFTWRGAIGTKPVLIAISVVALAQLAFTYLPTMHQLFDTRPVSPGNALLILTVGVTAMALLEGEKHLMRRLGLLQVF